MLGEFFDEKGVSAPQKLSYFFKKVLVKKRWFQLQNDEKYLQFKSDFHLGKRLENFIDGKGVSAPQKLSDFSKKMVSKNNDFTPKNMKNT